MKLAVGYRNPHKLYNTPQMTLTQKWEIEVIKYLSKEILTLEIGYQNDHSNKKK